MFVKGSLLLLAASGTSLGAPGVSRAEKERAKVTEIAVSEGPDPFTTTVSTVENLGGMSRFVPRGAAVLVKPNIGWDRRVEQGATTHPEVVRAVAAMCLESGAEKVVILDRTCNDARRCYRTSGMMDMVTNLSDRRVTLEFVHESRFRKVEIPLGVAIRSWPLYEEALRADIIINVPVAKHHSISRLTLGMKNLMGLLGGNRGVIHSNIGQKLADLTSAIDPALTVLDATRILIRNGPTGGRLEDVRVLNRVAASTDPVALDAYGAGFFGVDPKELSFVTAAYRMGLGEMDLTKVHMIEA